MKEPKVIKVDFHHSQYYPELVNKNQIDLHHTVSDPHSHVGDVNSFLSDPSRIATSIILGYNGNLSLSSPIDLDWDIYPKAIPFVKAIEACKERVVLSKTKNGRLSVKSGSFQAFVECLEEDIFPHQQPEGEYVPLQGDFIPAIKNIIDFI